MSQRVWLISQSESFCVSRDSSMESFLLLLLWVLRKIIMLQSIMLAYCFRKNSEVKGVEGLPSQHSFLAKCVVVRRMKAPSCSRTQARYFTLHLSCQSHWTWADFGSDEAVQCIKKKPHKPHSFGFHQSPDSKNGEEAASALDGFC